MKFTKLTMLLLFLFCAPMLLLAQTTCPSGSRIAPGFRTVNPSDGTINRPICVDNATGQYVYQTGNISLLAGSTLIFEGTTDDAFEATVSADDPAADYNLTLGEFTVTKDFGPTTAELITANGKFFIATRKYRVVDIDAVWTVEETTGSMDIMVERLQGIEACGSGDDLQTAAIDATGTAETVNNATLTATVALLSLAAGDRLCVTLTATPNEIDGIVVSVRLVPE